MVHLLDGLTNSSVARLGPVASQTFRGRSHFPLEVWRGKQRAGTWGQNPGFTPSGTSVNPQPRPNLSWATRTSGPSTNWCPHTTSWVETVYVLPAPGNISLPRSSSHPARAPALPRHHVNPPTGRPTWGARPAWAVPLSFYSWEKENKKLIIQSDCLS